MHKSIIVLGLFLGLLTHPSQARLWADTQGRTVDATLVRICPHQMVELKMRNGKMVKVPFSTFVEKDIEYLKSASLQNAPQEPSAITWEQMNQLFGVEIWKDSSIWDDPTHELAQRMNLRKESKTPFLENHRSYPLGQKKILTEPVFSVALYGDSTYADSLAFVFLNQGDLPPKISKKEMDDRIEASGGNILNAIIPLLGKAKRDSLGKGDLREKVWRWNWNGHAIMLSLQEGKYTALRIMPVDRADRSGRREKLNDNELKARMAACVQRRPNGDVIVENIPMVNQGPKGYCSPATWERYLRYVEISADMYLLALAADTGIGGGTYSEQMIDVTKSIISSNGRKLSDVGDKLTLKGVAKHIDKGLPIMWRLFSTPTFQNKANHNTARRNGRPVTEEECNSGQTEDTSSGGHICLIVGYNLKTKEIAISDSWGIHYAERWVDIESAQQATSGMMNVIKW